MLATVLPVTYLGNRGDAQASLRKREELHRRWHRQLGEDHPDTLAAAATLTTALTLGETKLRRARAAFGSDNLITLLSAAGLTLALAELGQTARARAVGEDTLLRSRTTLGPNHPLTQSVARTLNATPHNPGAE